MKNIHNIGIYKIEILSLLLLILFSFYSCTKETRKEKEEHTLILGHRAARTSNIIGNSFEAIKYGYSLLDGIEIDLMMSKDTTLWVIHDPSIITCKKDTVPVFSLTDSELREISECTKGTLVTLKEVFEYLSKTKQKTKFVSLDLKVLIDPYLNIEKKEEIIIHKIGDLYQRFCPNTLIAVESSNNNFLKKMKLYNSKIETYSLKLDKIMSNDIDDIISNKIDGLSCSNGSISKHLIDSLKSLNIKTQMWVINEPKDIKEVLKMKPFAIQTDNIEYIINKE